MKRIRYDFKENKDTQITSLGNTVILRCVIGRTLRRIRLTHEIDLDCL